jgi:FkbM family methyltransferase
MTIPFNRTIKQLGDNGLAKTISRIIGITIKQARFKIKYVPEMKTVNVNTCSMLLYPRKKGIHSELFHYRKREPMVTDFLTHTNLLHEGDTVLDIGANIGYYALLESKLVGETGTIYACEPVYENFRLLCNNVMINKATNIKVNSFAFGSKNGKGEIFVTQRCNCCTLRRNSQTNIIDVQQVPITTVDTFLKGKQTPTLIRMDVEGYEYEILKGMTETLKEDMMLLIEVHTVLLSNLEDFLDILEHNGYCALLVVFEEKVPHNEVVSVLLKNGGESYPKYYSNLSISKLREILKVEQVSPNVFFAKKETKLNLKN